MAPEGVPTVAPHDGEPAEAPAPPPAAAHDEKAAAPPTEGSAPPPAAAAADGAVKRGRDAAGGGEKQDKKRRKAAEEEVEAISRVVMKPGDAQALRAGLSGTLVTCPTMHERRAVVHVTKALAAVLPADCELTPTATGCGGCFLLLGQPGEEVATLDACSRLVLTTAEPTGGRAARVFPVQATCSVTAEALLAAAQALTAARLQAHPLGEGTTFTFAVLYHTRGHLDASDKLERTLAVKAVASGVEAACAAAGVPYKVNLSEPGAALMVDVLPVTLPGGKSCVTAALALLPAALLTFRPKLAARPVCIGQ